MPNKRYDQFAAGNPSGSRIFLTADPTTGALTKNTNDLLFNQNSSARMLEDWINTGGIYSQGHACGFSLWNAAGIVNLTTGFSYWDPVPIRACTLTGVYTGNGSSGSYTANNFNGFGLYSITGTTLNQIAITANSSAPFTSIGTTITRTLFISPVTVTTGIYFLAMMVSWSAVTTSPAMTICSAGIGDHMVRFRGLTNPLIMGVQQSQTSLPSSMPITNLLPGSSRAFYMGVY